MDISCDRPEHPLVADGQAPERDLPKYPPILSKLVAHLRDFALEQFRQQRLRGVRLQPLHEPTGRNLEPGPDTD